jgi:hypothetical protein
MNHGSNSSSHCTIRHTNSNIHIVFFNKINNSLYTRLEHE